MPMNPRLLVPRATFDPDAAAYLRAVEAADGQALEPPVKRAVEDFFRGTKADGTFSAIKAACLLCGARTLAGALVPLVGTAPTNVAGRGGRRPGSGNASKKDGFVEGDYTRGGATPGLKGDGTSYIDSGRSNNADAASDKHLAVYATNASTGVSEMWIGMTEGSYATRVFKQSNEVYFAYDGSTSAFPKPGPQPGLTGLVGLKRESSSSFSAYLDGTEVSKNEDVSSFGPYNHFVFAHNNAGVSATLISTSTFAYYSIGEATDLALLDARVTALVTAIGAAV